MRRVLRVMVCLLSLWLVSETPAFAGWGHNGGDGVVYYADDLARMQAEWRRQIAKAEPHYEYRTQTSCDKGVSFDALECGKAMKLCAGTGDGPWSDIWRRKVTAAGKEVEKWAIIGQTCLTRDVPGKTNPLPTIDMIVHAMHVTPWAKATIGFQPKGYLTLVNLPSFYAANWSASGFGPGEIDTVDPAAMFGHQVRIRPKLQSFTYHFGDGSSQGPTTSPGGVYPNGDVRHTYLKAGRYSAYVTVVWGADFSVDGTPWIEIPDTVSVNQPAQVIEVHTATNRLVQ